MAQAFTSFNNGIGAIVTKTVDFTQTTGDQFRLGLSNTGPTKGQSGQTYSFTNITEIATGGGYTRGTGIAITTGVNSNSGGTFTWIGTAALLTATSAGIATFQYAILYDDTASAKPLLGWWACAAAITMADTDTFQVSWGSNQILSFACTT